MAVSRCFVVHTTAGSWQVMARSIEAVRLLAAEFEPTATVLRIEPLVDWLVVSVLRSMGATSYCFA